MKIAYERITGDYIMLQWTMDSNGRDLCRQIKGMGRSPATLVVSGHQTEKAFLVASLSAIESIKGLGDVEFIEVNGKGRFTGSTENFIECFFIDPVSAKKIAGDRLDTMAKELAKDEGIPYLRALERIRIDNKDLYDQYRGT